MLKNKDTKVAKDTEQTPKITWYLFKQCHDSSVYPNCNMLDEAIVECARQE